MIFRLGERRQFRMSAITMRLGWLARAAFVFAQSRSVDCPASPSILNNGSLFFHTFPTAIRPSSIPSAPLTPHNHYGT
jgi:hypothetical protein